MKKNRLHFVFLLWFMASMSIANTHVHHDLNEHNNCVKCYTYNIMSGADAPISEPIRFDIPQLYTIIYHSDISIQACDLISFDARAPPSL